MLYDNAQLARVYLHAWQVTGNEFFRTITEEILDYVVQEMTDPAGGFYSTQDADSEGEEGKFFVWTPDEIREVLGSEADELMAAYRVAQRRVSYCSPASGSWPGEWAGVSLRLRRALSGARIRLPGAGHNPTGT
jgi:uncharacterized protein YyaL (SSP411 family)